MFLSLLTPPDIGLSSGIVLAAAYDTQHYSDDLFCELDIHQPSHLARAVNKRKAEYLAGRYLASCALQQLGADTQEVTTGLHRSPVWPKGFVGTLSHSKNIALCAVAPSRHIQALGLDIEPVMDEDTQNMIRDQVCAPSERSLLAAIDTNPAKALTYVFSAKESIFKALYPQVGDYFDFAAARLLTPNLAQNTLAFELTTTLTPTLPQHTPLQVRAEVYQDKILTSLIIETE